MKHLTIKTLLLIGAICPSFVACDDDKEPEVIYEFSVKVEDSAIAAPAEGCAQTILVTSTKTAGSSTTNVAYEVKSAPEWAPATIEQTALVINVAENSTTQAREPGCVTLLQAESGKELTINITQAGYEYSMSLAGSYTTPRCKVLGIVPEITGFDKNPIFAWTVKGPNDSEASAAGNGSTLNFIKLETGEYEVSLTVTDDSGISMVSTSKVNVEMEKEAYSPYLSEVIDLELAPYSSVGAGNSFFGMTDTKKSAMEKASEKLNKDFSTSNTGLSLGPLGGHIVFKFDHTVMNVNGLRDFRIGSYASQTAYPAPGIVYVAFDTNQNGQPDEDEWCEIAGSEYGKTTTLSNLTVIYNRPDNFLTTVSMGKEVNDYITYTINGVSGTLSSGSMPNTIPVWPFWLRESDEGKTITFTGVTKLPSNTQMNGMFPGATQWYGYGYVCNSDPKDEINSSFDIDWAVDKDGKPVHLPGVDFIKVQTATMMDAGGWYGALKTSLNCAIDLHIAGKQIETIKR